MYNIDKIMCAKLCVGMLCIWWHYPSGVGGGVSAGCAVLQYSVNGQAVRLLPAPVFLKSRSNSFPFGHGSVSMAVITSRCCRFWSLWFLGMTCATILTMRLCHQVLYLWYLLHKVLEGFLIKFSLPVVI